MQDETLEVEFNILATEKIRGKFERDKRKGRAEISTS
jgi:hypothetical protein